MQLVLAIALAGAGVPENTYFLVNTATLLAGVLVVAVIGVRRANRLRKV